MRGAGNQARAWLAGVLLLGSTTTVFADDCTDSGDCAMAPRNIDAAIGIAAAGPFIALAWLYFSRRNDGVDAAPLLTADELATDIDGLKEEFERLQEELRDRTIEELRNVDDFMRKYDEKWREGMFALEDYTQEYQHLLPGLQKIWEQLGSRDDARRYAEALDNVLMVAQMGVGLMRGAAGSAASNALDAARRAGTRAEAEAVRRAAREALGKEVQAMQAAERAAAERAAREAAERTAAREAAEQAAARKAAEEAALERAMDQKIADLAARRARAEKEILDQIKDINPIGHKNKNNCAFTSQAVEEGFAGRGKVIAIPEGPVPDLSWLEGQYGAGQFTSVGRGAQGKAAIERALATAPEGRGIVWVEWVKGAQVGKDGKPIGHLFNAVNKDGFVFFPDAQKGAMVSEWDNVGDVLFLLTN